MMSPLTKKSLWIHLRETDLFPFGPMVLGEEALRLALFGHQEALLRCHQRRCVQNLLPCHRSQANSLSSKLIPLIASISIIVILFMFWLRGSDRLFMPPQSAVLAAKLAKELSGTSIPPYVLEYGKFSIHISMTCISNTSILTALF